MRAPAPVDIARVQRRTLVLLAVTQVIGGVGVTVGIAVGALLAARLAGPGMAGLTQSGGVVGAALLVIPVSRLMQKRGRRPGLALAYTVGLVGAVLAVVAAVVGSILVMLAGMLLFGGGTAANLQARYTAVDLAEPHRRAGQLSLVVWATTIGAVAGPNLARPADRAVHGLGLPELAGPFLFSGLAFAIAAGTLLLLLRPDPLLLARTRAESGPGTDAGSGGAAPAELAPEAAGAAATPAGLPPAVEVDSGAPRGRSGGLRSAFTVVAARPAARLGLAAIAVGHTVMVAVMAMTPVHIDEALGHAGHGDVLRIVGIVLSVHIAGMYALSPLTGWLADRYGRRPVVLGGVVLLIAACALAGTAGDDTVRLSVGLGLLGMGWSGTMIAGSTLLTEAVPDGIRPSVQGLGDFVMGLAGAAGGALSGLIVEFAGYPVLTLIAALVTVPLIAAALRRPAEPGERDGPPTAGYRRQRHPRTRAQASGTP